MLRPLNCLCARRRCPHIAENAPPPVPNHDGFAADPAAHERFAREVEDLIEALKRARSKQIDAAIFRSPSTDPASLRATSKLADDGYYQDGTPVDAISLVIRDLDSQATAARQIAREYRAMEEEAARRLREAGETET